MYATLLEMDRDMKNGMKLKSGQSKRSTFAVLNTIIGIENTLQMDCPVVFSVFFSIGYVDSCLILICICSYLDLRLKAIFECKLSLRRHEPRDILLEYKTKMREQNGKELRLLAMPRQDFRLVFIPSTLHFLIIRPVHHVSSSIITLFLFLLYTMVIATVEATTRGSSFFIAYNAVIDYSCGIGSQFLLGDIWEYLFVTLGLIGLILFYFTVWQISLSVVEGLGWIARITDEATPIFIP